MSRRQLLRLGLVFVACLPGHWLAAHAHGVEPNATVRFFLEILPSGQEFQNWEAEDSRRIVAYHDPALSGQTERFGTPDYISYFELGLIYDGDNLLLDLQDTAWVRTPVVHVTGAGVASASNIYWLELESEAANDLLKNLAGATATTGPEGEVVVLHTYRVSRGNNGLLFIDSYTPNQPVYYQVRISMGRFQK